MPATARLTIAALTITALTITGPHGKGPSMGISSSMNAGVSGLNANANKLATISDNIANSQTYGYKRADIDFSSMTISDFEVAEHRRRRAMVHRGRSADPGDLGREPTRAR